jgi:hypothetical protein
MGFFTWIWIVFIAGSADQAAVHFEIPYDKQILVFRIAVLVLPVLVFALTLRICRDLRDSDVRRCASPGRRPYGGGHPAGTKSSSPPSGSRESPSSAAWWCG